MQSSLSRARAKFLTAHFDYLEEVSEAVQRRFDKNVALADEFARLLTHLSECVGFIMTSPVMPEASPPQDFFYMLDRAAEMADRIPGFGRMFERFVSEHAALLNPSTIETLRKFIQWIPQERSRLASHANSQLEQMRLGIEAAAAEDRELAAEWSLTDSDGWPE